MKTMVMTGAASGIGRAIAAQLRQLNYHILSLGRSAPAPDPHIDHITVDLGDTGLLAQTLEQLPLESHDIHGLISCAGSGMFKSLEEFSWKQITGFIDLNLTAHVLLCRRLVPVLKKAGRGDVILMGSEAALRGAKRASLYCACKFALRGLAQSLRAECANAGVRVSILQPGMVDTPFYDQQNFRPGPLPQHHLLAEDVARAVITVLSAPAHVVFDEIVINPLSKVIDFKPK